MKKFIAQLLFVKTQILTIKWESNNQRKQNTKSKKNYKKPSIMHDDMRCTRKKWKMKWHQKFTRDSSGLRELPKDARPKGVLV